MTDLDRSCRVLVNLLRRMVTDAESGAKLSWFAKACAGWFGLYVAVCGIGPYLVVPSAYTDKPGCYPHYEMIGIGSNCPVAVVNIFWLVVLGLPELFIMPMSLVVGFFRGFFDNFPDPHHLLSSMPSVAISIPVLLVYYFSYRYWRRERGRVAILLPLAIVVEAVRLGLLV